MPTRWVGFHDGIARSGGPEDFEKWTRSGRYAEDFAKHCAQIAKGLPLNSMALIKEAKAEGILNSFIIYDGLYLTGNWRVGHWLIADYNRIRFDNMTRSIRGLGLHSVYRDPWWSWWNFTWWMVGVKWTNLPWWIDRRISSGW